MTPLEKGAKAWLITSKAGQLPEGSEHRLQVEIHDWVQGRFNVSAQGKRWNVSIWNLDAPREYRTRQGRWLRESDPRVLDALEKLLVLEMKNLDMRRSASETIPWFVQEYVDGLLWILERNGRKRGVVLSAL